MSSDSLPPPGKSHVHYGLRFWAQGGFVCIETMSGEGDVNVVSRAEFTARIIAMNKTVKAGGFDKADERKAAHDFIESGVACCREAKKQGDPMDAKMSEEMRRLRKRKGFLINNSVVVPGTLSSLDSPEQAAMLPPMPKHPLA